jgi:hypothetical protein
MSPVLENKLINIELKICEEFLGSKKQVAELLSVDRSAVTRWHRGENPDKENSVKLAGLNYLISILRTEYNPDSIAEWFRGLNFHLQSQRPVDLIAMGRINEVIQAALQDAAGSYA